jgi:hypothetical protein
MSRPKHVNGRGEVFCKRQLEKTPKFKIQILKSLKILDRKKNTPAKARVMDTVRFL